MTVGKFTVVAMAIAVGGSLAASASALAQPRCIGAYDQRSRSCVIASSNCNQYGLFPIFGPPPACTCYCATQEKKK